MRNVYCPVCGRESAGQVEVKRESVEAAVCSDRCGTAFAALALLRTRESENEVLEDRRREEWTARQPHTPVLSELLLQRWRAGDWAVEPAKVLSCL